MNHDFYADAYLKDILERVRVIAMIGASPKPIRPSFFVMKYLQGKGFRVVPVNPGIAGQEISGERVFGSLADISFHVDMVDVFRNSEAAGAVTDEAIAEKDRLGISVLWMQLGVRNDAAAARAEEAGIQVIMDRCPKIEYARLYGELGWQGINTNIITTKRRPIRPVKR